MKRVSLPFRPEVVACSAGGGGVRRLHELGDAHMKTHYIQLLCVLFVIAVLAACVLAIRSGPLLAAYFIRSGKDASVAWHASSTSRNLYAVSQFSKNRGHISVYDIDAGHRLIKTIHTVADVEDVKGVTVSAVTGKLYVTYRNKSGVGMIYCVNVYNDAVLWNRAIDPGVDRLAINPDGELLYVPTWEGGSANYINVLDANTGDVIRRVYFSNRSHDTQYPLSGPIFQETKASDGSGNYLYLIDPSTYAVSRIGPYFGILGPYAVDGTSTYAANNVSNLWGMQVANLKTGQIITATIPNHPPEDAGLLHGIGWTPDEREVWESSTWSDPHIYIWDMLNPMAPVLRERLTLRSSRGAHWLTFDIKGDYAYVAPNKNSDDETEIFNVRTHTTTGAIASSEDLLEIDFANGRISQVGDQYGIGRAMR
jgi:6-phosphogluconolactonase (cycloisomerase 2 family)